MSREVRELIFRMVAENTTWGAARIHGELMKLGFKLGQSSGSKFVEPCRSSAGNKSWQHRTFYSCIFRYYCECSAVANPTVKGGLRLRK